MSISKSRFQTKKIGEKLARKILMAAPRKTAFIIGLNGDLGSGKTTFLQGLARGLGIKAKVNSPTFVIMKKFKNFYHFDCYRIQDAKEILALGWQGIIKNPKNIVAVEWANRIKKIMPKNTLRLKFKFVDKTKRKILMI